MGCALLHTLYWPSFCTILCSIMRISQAPVNDFARLQTSEMVSF
ncbi:hypothetical protein CISIN_1g035435mg [Citrus sinensis]|uniref:Uncharacterized protein n=1 Tax=Citrus sinensis TaxID=2711 RepID=A0A067D6N6_CITSI|nr:hypothetical protein CISIN_1g035435mg [Citrus sinensis]